MPSARHRFLNLNPIELHLNLNRNIYPQFFTAAPGFSELQVVA